MTRDLAAPGRSSLFSAHWPRDDGALLVEEPVDVQDDQQPVLEPGEAGDVLMRDRQDRQRRRLDLIAVDPHDLGDRVNDAADRLVVDVDHDRAGLVVDLAGRQAESLAQVDDRDHRPPQVDQPLDEVRHLGNPRDRLHQDDFLDLGDGDRVVFVVQPEAHELDDRVIAAAGSPFRGLRPSEIRRT